MGTPKNVETVNDGKNVERLDYLCAASRMENVPAMVLGTAKHLAGVF